MAFARDDVGKSDWASPVENSIEIWDKILLGVCLAAMESPNNGHVGRVCSGSEKIGLGELVLKIELGFASGKYYLY